MATTADIIEVDKLSFVVRAQKFRVAASIMKRTVIPLATEYATRLIHLVRGISPEELATFFDFEVPETRVLLEEVLSSSLIEEKGGLLYLSEQGEKALSPMDDTLNLFDVEEIPAVVSLDLIAFAPIDDVELEARAARIVEELPIPDRVKAANAVKSAQEAFDIHFHEWRQKQGRRRGLDEDSRVRTIGDVKVVKSFAAPLQVPVRCRLDDVPGTAPDFTELTSKGRSGSRDALVEALSHRIQNIAAPRDHAQAFDYISDLDGGIFRRDEVRTSADQGTWAALAADPDRQPITGWAGPGLRLVGSTATSSIRSALLEWTQGVGGASPVKCPVFWLPPNLPHWGRSLEFVELATELSSANSGEDGTVLLARTDGVSSTYRMIQRCYGRGAKIEPLFDRCLALTRPALSDALELIVKPRTWALALIHAPDPQTNYPFPFGYIVAAPGTVARYVRVLAELAALAGPSNVLWNRSDESADGALSYIDEALGIQVAGQD